MYGESCRQGTAFVNEILCVWKVVLTKDDVFKRVYVWRVFKNKLMYE